MSTYLMKKLVNTNEIINLIGLSKDTLRRYRKDGILKKGIDWKYKDVYGRRISWDVENVQKAIHEHATKRLETA